MRNFGGRAGKGRLGRGNEAGTGRRRNRLTNQRTNRRHLHTIYSTRSFGCAVAVEEGRRRDQRADYGQLLNRAIVSLLYDDGLNIENPFGNICFWVYGSVMTDLWLTTDNMYSLRHCPRNHG